MTETAASPIGSVATALPAVLERIDADLDQSLERLFELMAIPSVSTQPDHAKDCAAAAEWLRAELASLGFDAELVRMAEVDGGHPLVVARSSGPAPGAARPRALFYGHYDVQPVDPLSLWSHDPFTPFIDRSAGPAVIRGRGASDDKGQLMTFLEACRAWKAVAGAPPVDLAILLEGEEESGGASMGPFLRRHGDRVAADVALVCDTTMWSAEQPAITTSLRGMLACEVTIRAANRDLHSGFYGSAARNPIAVLTRMLAALRDPETGRVTLEGFYDGAPETPDAIRRQWEQLGFDVNAFLGDIGLSQAAGEAGYSALEQVWARPTAEINGISGGYQDPGFKTVIPAEASAKVSFRLVGDQDPEAVRQAFEAHIRAHTPEDCSFELVSHGASPAARVDYDAPDLKAASEALAAEWGRPAALIGAGGSIPVVGDFKSILGMETLLIGFALESDRIHSPNEQYALRSFHQGARSWARILAALAETPKRAAA
ncbi:MAG: M20/M25/M40 family metallo-hydrolase [Pseudomonadota bacterium]